MRQFHLKRGAPPDEELFIRLTLQKRYKPNFDIYDDWPEAGLRKPTNVLEAMTYDAEAAARGHTDPLEIIEDDNVRVIWEVVDRYGNVWSEESPELLARIFNHTEEQ